jgi:hypothetical protein
LRGAFEMPMRFRDCACSTSVVERIEVRGADHADRFARLTHHDATNLEVGHAKQLERIE